MTAQRCPLCVTKILQKRLRLEFPDRVVDVLPEWDGKSRHEYGQANSKILQIQSRVESIYKSAVNPGITWQDIYDESDPNTSLWSVSHQGAECLYLILSVTFDEDGSALRFFNKSEIGDKIEY